MYNDIRTIGDLKQLWNSWAFYISDASQKTQKMIKAF